jgi:hypothetical protein
MVTGKGKTVISLPPLVFPPDSCGPYPWVEVEVPLRRILPSVREYVRVLEKFWETSLKT